MVIFFNFVVNFLQFFLVFTKHEAVRTCANCAHWTSKPYPNSFSAGGATTTSLPQTSYFKGSSASKAGMVFFECIFRKTALEIAHVDPFFVLFQNERLQRMLFFLSMLFIPVLLVHKLIIMS